MKLSLFLPVWLENAHSRPKLGAFFWGGDYIPKMGSNIDETTKRQMLAPVRVV